MARVEADAKPSAEEIDATYRAIGRYVYEFSRMIFIMRLQMEAVLNPKDEPELIAEVALGTLTAEPITRAFFKMCEMRGHLDEDECEISRHLREKVLYRVRQRNDLLHGDWFVGSVALERDDGTVSYSWTRRIKPSNRDGARSHTDWPPSTLEHEADEIVELRQMVAEFGTVALRLVNIESIYVGGDPEPPEELRVRDLWVKRQKDTDDKRRKNSQPDIVVRAGPLAKTFVKMFYK